MKASSFIKLFFVLSLILFVDYILIALPECAVCLLGSVDESYSCTFCLDGKIILVLLAIFLWESYLPDIKAIIKSISSGASE